MPLVTVPIVEIVSATPRSRLLCVDLGGRTIEFLPGQAVMAAAHGHDERRPYSIACSPERTAETGRLEFLVALEPGGENDSHMARVAAGSSVDIEGPLGQFTFPTQPDQARVLFVAGGTGIAPLRSMISQAFQTGQRGRLHLLYSARTPLDFAYLRELRRYARDGRLDLALNATREVPAGWRGERGRITRDRLARMVEDPATLCFVCGPAAMVDEVPRMLMDIGIERKRIRLEEW